MLKQVTSLFLSNVDRLSESQIGAFDGLLVPLIERMEAVTLAHLSEALSTTDLAPGETIRRLAFHNDALVAAPVLRNSNRLSEKDLVEIAKTRSQQHLLAISGRESLNEALTDALMRLGDANVSNALARNAGAKFSECGYATLVGRAERDESLTEKLGLRLDLPAKSAARTSCKGDRPGAGAIPDGAATSRAGKATGEAIVATAPRADRRSTTRRRRAKSLHSIVRASSTIQREPVCGEGRYTNVVAALSLKTDVKIEAIEPLIESDRLYGLIVACKAARLNWSTTTMIIRNRPGCPPATQREFEQAQAVFEGLLLSLAQWTIRFGADRMAATKVGAAAAPAAKKS